MIVGLSGYAQSGKDTVARILVEEHGYTQIAFADVLRECLAALNPLIYYKRDYIRLKNGVDWYGWEQLKERSPDVRPLLQRMGTDVGRNILGEDTWVNATLGRMTDDRDWAISDCRFPNEAKAICECDGAIIRITRPDHGPANAHISEVALDDYPFDFRIDNDATLADLRVRVSAVVGKLGSIYV